MRKCIVCSHPGREAIDLDLVAGKSLRTIADRCELSRYALFRHQRDHLPAGLARAAEARAPARATTVAAQVERQEVQSEVSRFGESAEQ